jgi:hypothetical protein
MRFNNKKFSGTVITAVYMVLGLTQTVYAKIYYQDDPISRLKILA